MDWGPNSMISRQLPEDFDKRNVLKKGFVYCKKLYIAIVVYSLWFSGNRFLR